MTSRTALLLTAVGVLATGSPAVAHDEISKLAPGDGAADDEFGGSVSLAGGLALVGMRFDDDHGAESGAVYLFDAKTGLQRYKLTPADGATGDHFGHAVALHGGLALVGAPGDNDGGADSGSAYLFDATTGVELHKLTSAGGAAGDGFGFSVSLNGGLALVGAYRDDDHGEDSGAAYVFDVSSGAQLLKLTPGDGAARDYFGVGVSLDGGLALVGASGDDDHGSSSGSAYLLDATSGQELHKLTPGDGAKSDSFGFSVSLDGGLALVGATGDDDNGFESGAGYVFDAGSGQQLHKLKPLDGSEWDLFGLSVSLSAGMALVGAVQDIANGSASGSAYVFDAVTGQELYELYPGDGGDADWFGTSASLDGMLALVGAKWDDVLANHSGSAYVFDALSPGHPYCSGDLGSGSPCPCGNDNDGSVPGSGCANGVFASGARVAGEGVASLGHDSLVLVATHLEPNNTGLYFQADNDLSPGVLWGDGLRCAGGNLKRLQVRFADAAGASFTTVGISAKVGNIIAGGTKYYQCWYRTTANPPCGAGVNDFNSSNGYSVTWLP